MWICWFLLAFVPGENFFGATGFCRLDGLPVTSEEYQSTEGNSQGVIVSHSLASTSLDLLWTRDGRGIAECFPVSVPAGLRVHAH